MKVVYKGNQDKILQKNLVSPCNDFKILLKLNP